MGKMSLEDYMYKYKISGKNLAKMIGCTPVTVCRWRKGTQKPVGVLLSILNKITNGEVEL